MADVDTEYDSGGLRASADQHARTEAACVNLGEVLADIALSTEISGTVAAAAAFHTAATG